MVSSFQGLFKIPIRITRCAPAVVAGALCVIAGAGRVDADPSTDATRTHIRAGSGANIISARRSPHAAVRQGRAAGGDPFPHPRLSGFSPLVAIATSDAGFRLGHDLEFEHQLEPTYVGAPLNPGASPNFIIGFLDSGSDVELAAGSFAVQLGLSGANLTSTPIPIGGVGGEVDATITMPVGFFAAGLSAIDAAGFLDFSALVGHSNVCGLAAPALDCGNGEILTAVIGTPLMAFHTTVIRVDDPQTVVVGGTTYQSPDVQLLDPFDPIPFYPYLISMELGGASPIVTTANYYMFPFANEDPILPTLLSIGPGLIPSGGSFFSSVFVVEGPPSPTNPAQEMRLLVDTGAQSSIISRAMAANLSLPVEPDFTVDVCGVGGLAPNIPGYYLDYVKINAFGGALEFSHAPFVVLDLPSPEGGVLDGILGMNFFWNRNVIFEPALGFSAFLHVSDPIPVPFGDGDVDFDVDLSDAERLLACVSGPGTVSVSPECDHFDRDQDGDVDLFDYRELLACFGGSDVLVDPACAAR